MPRAYALTSRRLAETADYVRQHAHRYRGTPPMVAYRFETPAAVARTLTRIYGRPVIPGDGEVAYWMIADRGARLGIDLR